MFTVIITGCLIGVLVAVWIISAVTYGMMGMHVILSLIICVTTLFLVQQCNEYDFEKHHTTTYFKPTIKYFEKQSDKLMIVLDNTVIYKTDFRWLNTNSIMLEVKCYKDTTNKKICYKD